MQQAKHQTGFRKYARNASPSYFIANVFKNNHISYISNSALLVVIISLIIYLATSYLLQNYLHIKSSPCKIHPIKYIQLSLDARYVHIRS